VHEQHVYDLKRMPAHFVEWPEQDEFYTNLNAAWKFIPDPHDQSRKSVLHVTKEIEDMPEYQQFLEDAAQFRIA